MPTDETSKKPARKETTPAKSIPLAEGGINTSKECSAVLSAMTRDVLVGAITPQVCNAGTNTIGKQLKLKEMEIKYGQGHGDDRVLMLT